MYKYLALLCLFVSCQSVKIKGDSYKVSESEVFLGSIGQGHSLYGLDHDFDARSIPVLHNKIRLQVEVLPYDKDLNEIYLKKAKYDQSQKAINYVDSLAQKPELVTFRLFDVAGFLTELNAEHNSDLLRLLVDTKKTSVVSSVAVNLPKEDSDKIRNADTYYLSNDQDRKLTVQLFKSGKKTDAIDLDKATVIAYRLGTFCWSISDRGKPYIADIAEQDRGCKGKTSSHVTEKKKEKSLYNM